MKKITLNLKKSIISDIKLNTKSIIVYIFSILSSLVVIFAIINGIELSQEKRHSDMQKKIVIASESLMEMTIESGVNIAKSIYVNESIYQFLNTKYSSSGEYYDAFYSLQQNNPMAIADTNIINSYVVYSENPTILTGGNISTFSSVLDSNWYHQYKKINKPMILYIDPETDVVSIIRRLDFQNLITGESCLKLDLNMNLVRDYCDNLDFDGELYIINGGSLIYSNIPDIEIEDTDINPDFECYIKNYYASDIEYYAYENRQSLSGFIMDNIMYIILFVVFTTAMIISGITFNTNIKKRIRHSAEMILNEKSMNTYNNGKDEIGEILDMCIKASEKLAENTMHNRRKNEEFQESSSRYNELLNMAMQLSAELIVSQKYHNIFRRFSEDIPLEDEIDNMRHITRNIEYTDTFDIKVPAYSLFMIAEDLKSENLSINIIKNKNTTDIIFKSDIQEQFKILKLNAIFEESSIADAYSFGYNNPYNPYMRIVHCLGDRISAKIKNKNNFTLCISIKSEKSDLYEN